MEQFYSRCLLCTCRPDVTPHLHIFSEAGKQLQLADKINKYLNIQIEAELPQNVCHSCLQKLEVTPNELVTNSQRARIMLLQMKQQSLSQEIKQENLDCSETELDSYQPATHSAAIDNEMDIKASEIPMDSSNCYSADFDQSALHSNMERTPVNTEPFEEVLISQFNIEEHAIKQEPGEEKQLDCLLQNADEAMNYRNYRSKNLECTECKTKYIYPEMLAWHRQYCHGTGASVKVVKINDKRQNFQCLLCETVLKSQELTIMHLHRQHKMSNLPFQCSLCDKSFMLNCKLINHELKCKNRKTAKYDNDVTTNFHCVQCHLVFDSEVQLSDHILIFHGKKKRELHLKCGHCTESFHSFPKLKSHCLSVHPGRYILQCELCMSTFTTYCAYSQHKKYKHTDQLNCNICTIALSSAAAYREHMKNIHSKSQLTCNFCNIKFEHKTYLCQHIWQVHIQPLLKCECCEFTTRKVSRLENHVKSKHIKKTFACNFCTAKFKLKPILNKHIRNVHTISTLFHCQDCSYTTRRKYHLNQHIKLKHSVFNETVSCKTCSATFKCEQYLRQHIRSVHTDPLLQCEHCTHSTRRKCDLIKHMRHKHLLLKTVLVCNFCGKTFRWEQYLKQHVNDMHTGKLLQCQFCQYTTRRRSTLTMHLKQVHSNGYKN